MPQSSRTSDPEAWAIIMDYASGVIDSIPEVHKKLTEYLGDGYKYDDWKEAFRVIEMAETDTVAAIAAIKPLLENATNPTPSTHHSTSQTLDTLRPPLPQLERLENELNECVSQLQSWGWIRGQALSLEEMLNPVEEDIVGETGVEFPGGDKDIIERVIHGDDEESDEDEEDEEPLPEVTTPSKALDICAQMERLCLEYASSSLSVVDLQFQVRKLRGHIRHLNDQSCVQSSLDQFFVKPTNEDVSMH